MFSGLEWEFPVNEISSFAAQNMGLIMPLLVLLVAVLLTFVVIDGLTDILLKIIGFVAGVRASDIGSSRQETSLGLNNDRELD